MSTQDGFHTDKVIRYIHSRYARDGLTEAEEMETVNPEVWFNDSWTEELYEQSMKLGQYPTILTLLWLP